MAQARQAVAMEAVAAAMRVSEMAYYRFVPASAREKACKA